MLIEFLNTVAASFLVHDVLGLGLIQVPLKLPMTPICYTLGTSVAILSFGWSLGALGFMTGNAIFIVAGMCGSDLTVPASICDFVGALKVPCSGLSSLFVGALFTLLSVGGWPLRFTVVGFAIDVSGAFCGDSDFQKMIPEQFCSTRAALPPVTGPALCLLGNVLGLMMAAASALSPSTASHEEKAAAKKKKKV